MTTQKHWCAIEMLTGAIEGLEVLVRTNARVGGAAYDERGRILENSTSMCKNRYPGAFFS